MPPVPTPEILEHAPAWTTTLFWIVAGIGSALIALRQIMAGMKIEGAKLAAGAPPTPTKEIMGTVPAPQLPPALVAIGGGFVDRVSQEESVQTGKRVAVALEALAVSMGRLATAQEKQATLDEKEAYEAEILKVAERLADQRVAERLAALKAGGRA